MLDFIFNPKAKLPVWLYGEGRTIKRFKGNVLSGAVEHSKEPWAFHMMQDFMMRDHIKGGLAIIVWQRDAFPRNPFRNVDEAYKRQLQDIDKIADEAGRTAKDKALEDRRKNSIFMALIALGLIFGIVILIIMAFTIWRNGGISL